MNRETYFRVGCVSFTVRATDWPEQQAAEWAEDYLVTHVRAMPPAGVCLLHSALLDERDHPEAAPSHEYAEAIRDVRDHEGRAVLFACADWLMRPTTGHAVRLCPAGDASKAGEP